MTPYSHDDWLTVYQGDCREVMRQMEPESVHCVVTSPPYWGLRDYGTATWVGGDEDCDHADPDYLARVANSPKQQTQAGSYRLQERVACRRCGATRVDSQLGLEATPEEFVANMVDVFREVWRVLRSDGTCWVNLGDSYVGGNSGGTYDPETWKPLAGGPSDNTSWQKRMQRTTLDTSAASGLPPKNLVGIPWRVAFALQADGWYLRSDIIWAKPNPMPESVTDRPTKSHEYLFLLTKSARYYYDADAVREPGQDWSKGGPGTGILPTTHYHPDNGGNGGLSDLAGRYKAGEQAAGRNLRTVWTIATAPYPGAHFATFPPKLVEPCIKAGAPEKVCGECGAGWRRVTETEFVKLANRRPTRKAIQEGADMADVNSHEAMGYNNVRTVGFIPSCSHVQCRDCGRITSDADTVARLSGMRPDLPSEVGSTEPLLLEGMREPGDSADAIDDEGLRAIGEGLHLGVPTDPSDGAPERLLAPAPSSDGGADRAIADLGRDRGSHQRDQGRQPAGEPAHSDEEGARRPIEPGTGADGDLSGVRPPLHAPRTCGQCGGDLALVDTAPAVVLDCFAGSGTVGMVAQSLSRRAVLIDLNGDYLVQAMSRNQQSPLGLETA